MGAGSAAMTTVAHLTTIDLSLRFLLMAQLRGARDAGYDVVGISAPGPWVAELEADGIRHIALYSSTRAADPRADVRSARELWGVLRREQPTVLHTHNPKPGFYGRVLGRIADIPIVVNTIHGLYATPDDPLTKRALVYGLEAVASRFSDVELVQNPEDLALLRRLRMGGHAQLLGNGIDLRRFDPARWSSRDRARVRAELRVADDQLVIGVVARLVAEKGLPELFDAVGRLESARYVLVCVGGNDPDKPDALPRTTIEAARAAGVRFLGHRDDVDALYAAMDLFVLPSHREGFPRAAMEAAASGLPVIATDVRGCRQVVEPEVTGILVPVRDADALARAIERLGADDALRTRMAVAARARAEAQFDERVVVTRVLDAYAAVAARKRIEVPR
jgi:glycosyltransferase involved in cell wall biosynthesis